MSFSCREGFIPFGAAINKDNCNGPMARIVHFGKSKGKDFDMNLRSIRHRFDIKLRRHQFMQKTTSIHSEIDIGLTSK